MTATANTPASELRAQVKTLTGLKSKLPPRDQDFAQKLITYFAQHNGLTIRMAPWVLILISRAKGENLEPEVTTVDLSGLSALFAKAGAALKRPAITLRLPTEGDLRISIAGSKSKYPGQLMLTDGMPYGRNRYYGRVTKEGQWVHPLGRPVPEEVTETVSLLSVDPAAAASRHGKLTGFCCFCALPLSDKQSVRAGFGETCAKNYGLLPQYKAAK